MDHFHEILCQFVDRKTNTNRSQLSEPLIETFRYEAGHKRVFEDKVPDYQAERLQPDYQQSLVKSCFITHRDIQYHYNLSRAEQIEHQAILVNRLEAFRKKGYQVRPDLSIEMKYEQLVEEYHRHLPRFVDDWLGSEKVQTEMSAFKQLSDADKWRYICSQIY